MNDHDRHVKAEALREESEWFRDIPQGDLTGPLVADILVLHARDIENGADDKNETTSPGEEHRRYLERGGWNG